MNRILHIYKTFKNSNAGGVERVINNICSHTENITQSTILVCNENSSLTDKINISNEISIIKSQSFGNLFSMPLSLTFLLNIHKEIRKNYSIILCHYPMPLTDIMISLFYNKKKNTNQKLFYWWHSDIINQKFLKYIFYPFIFLSLKKIDKIIVSNVAIVKYSPILKYFENKIEVIPFYIEKFPFNNNEDDYKIEQNINSQFGNFILSVGRLVSYKGFNILIQSYHKIFNDNLTNPKIPKLIIIGNGKCNKQLNLLIKKLKLENNIFILNNISDNEIKYFFKLCEFYVLSSISSAETFAISQVEAMQFGKAIINTNLKSGVPYVAVNNIEAVTVEPNNINALANAITKLIFNTELRNKLGKNAKIKFDKEFNNNKFFDKLLK